MDLAKLRRSVSAAQSILKEIEPSMIIDGKPGSFTETAYNRAPADLKQQVDAVVAALGIQGGMKAAIEVYKTEKAKLTTSSSTSGSSVFDLQVVPAIVREARRRNLNPVNYLTQLCLESGYGKSTPLQPDGKPSYNYGGIKWQTDKTALKAPAMTPEVIKGKRVRIMQDFAVYDSPDAFAKAYFRYLFDSPSARRFRGLADAKTPFEHGAILQQGGYATDPEYASSFAKVAKTVSRRYDVVA